MWIEDDMRADYLNLVAQDGGFQCQWIVSIRQTDSERVLTPNTSGRIHPQLN
jgi:hypothetical protein